MDSDEAGWRDDFSGEKGNTRSLGNGCVQDHRERKEGREVAFSKRWTSRIQERSLEPRSIRRSYHWNDRRWRNGRSG